MLCESSLHLWNAFRVGALVGLSHLILLHSVQAGPIPKLDLSSGNAGGCLSVDSLKLSTRGQAGLAEMEDAVACFRQGATDQAFDHLEAAAVENVRLPPATVMLARLFLTTGQVAEGRRILEQAAVEHPASPDVHLVFGDLALAEGRIADAALHFEEARSLLADLPAPAGPRPRETWLGLAAVAEFRQQWAEAERWLRKSLRVAPRRSLVWRRLAEVQFEQQRFEEAEQSLRAADQFESESEPAPLLMARWHHVAGRAADAEKWLRVALEEAPENQRVIASAVIWCLEVDRLEEAQQHAKKLASLQPDSPDTLRLQGLVATFRQDFVTAEQSFQTLLIENPADFAASNQLALVLIEQEDAGQRRRATQLAELNVRQYPRAAEAFATLGWVYYRQGRLEEAEQIFQPIIDGGHYSPDTAYYLARLLADRNRIDAARQILEPALDAPGAFRHRGASQKLLATLSITPSQTAEE